MQILVLAAGMSTRFGSLKQFTPIDEFGNFILDYSLNNAYKAGFDDFVFVIRKEIEDVFLNTIYKRLIKFAKVSYVFQNISPITNKPLGTASALLASKKLMNSAFLVINSDDYYTKNTFDIAYEFIYNNLNNSKYLYANISYKVENTIFDNEYLSRAIIKSNNGYIESFEETKVKKDNNLFITNTAKVVEKETNVSMGLFCFTKDIFELIDTSSKVSGEYLLPEIISSLIKENKIKVVLLESFDKTIGLTYYSDLEKVKRYLINDKI